jgi:hypothetical protein
MPHNIPFTYFGINYLWWEERKFKGSLAASTDLCPTLTDIKFIF